MHWVIIAAVALFLLVTCQDNGKSARETRAASEARIEREVQQRVRIEVAQKAADLEQKYSARQAELHTIRAVGFILLAGGALGGLIWLQRHRSYNPPQSEERQLQMPTWRDHYPVASTRVLDLQPPGSTASLTSPLSPAPQEAWMDNNNPPPRRRARRRHYRNRTHRNQDHDETPRYR